MTNIRVKECKTEVEANEWLKSTSISLIDTKYGEGGYILFIYKEI